MVKTIPAILKSHILPFNWEVKKVWKLKTPVIAAKRSDFDYLLNLPIWSSRPNAGMLFDITPTHLLLEPESCPYQIERIAEADTQYPLDFLDYQNKLWILDGVHRLAKLHQNKVDMISIRIHQENILSLIQRNEV